MKRERVGQSSGAGGSRAVMRYAGRQSIEEEGGQTEH